MMPTPSHLVECTHPSSGAPDENEFESSILCPCGSKRFDLLFPGQTHSWEDQQLPCVAEINGKFFFLVKARCTACQKEHLLLDIDYHGWNGFVCHDPEQASLARPLLTAWHCMSCGNTEHVCTIQVQSNGVDDFVEETAGEFPRDRWQDGFGWLGIDIQCTQCNNQTKGWVSCETM